MSRRSSRSPDPVARPFDRAVLARLLRDRRGTGAVEFALVAVPLVALLLGSVEVARVLWTQTALERTAISSARCIGIRGGACSAEGVYDAAAAVAFVTAEAAGWGLALSAADIAVTDNASCGGQPGQSGVTLTSDNFSPLPFVATMMGASQTMSASACFPTQAPSAG